MLIVFHTIHPHSVHSSPTKSRFHYRSIELPRHFHACSLPSSTLPEPCSHLLTIPLFTTPKYLAVLVQVVSLADGDGPNTVAPRQTNPSNRGPLTLTMGSTICLILVQGLSLSSNKGALVDPNRHDRASREPWFLVMMRLRDMLGRSIRTSGRLYGNYKTVRLQTTRYLLVGLDKESILQC